MANRIKSLFKKLRAQKKKALIVYITAGDPNLVTTFELVLALEKSGVDMVELGIPFSDPVADGPTIQAASYRSLLKGTNLRKVFRTVRALRDKTDIPIVFMTYYNLVYRYGIETFFRDCETNGVDGVIVPDLPCDEAQGLVRSAKRHKVSSIFLVAPTSAKVRIRQIARQSTGFIYYISLTGVTGARRELPEGIRSQVRSIKATTAKPVCVGFGISTPSQATAVARVADGVIVGSAVVKIIAAHQRDYKRLRAEVSGFAQKLAHAIHNV